MVKIKVAVPFSSRIIGLMKIGKIDIDKPLCLAPMEDVTDAPYRRICHKLGADIVYTEFTASEAIIRNIYKSHEKMRVFEDERPVAIQIFGGKEESIEEAARIAETFKPDFIDINCGCWVKNVVARTEGAGLLRDLPLFEKIVKSAVRGTSLPVTVKTRLGWDMDSICILDVAKMVEDAGAQALAVHCRVRSQGHGGEAQWHWLEKIKKVISIPLIGNGDIVEPQDAARMFETGCDGVMIGRGAIGNPWIFRQCRYFMETGEIEPLPSINERVDVCLEHLRLSIEKRGLPRGIYSFRKNYAGYLKGLPHAANVRKELVLIDDYATIEERLFQYRDQLNRESLMI